MYITFYKNYISKPKRTDALAQFLAGTFEEIPEETAPQIKKITAEKPAEDFHNFWDNNYFSGNNHITWEDIPKPPSWPIEEIHQHYHSFKIPKKSGGLRDIDAPDPELKAYLTQLKLYFENTLKILPHDCAHAYVKNRSVITDLKVHQANESKWFLKLDLKNFFPSHNIDYVMDTLKNIYPIGILMYGEDYTRNLKNALQYAFLDNKLPQGTPLSPTLTNILMVGIDYKIQHMLWNKKNRFVYTRYADDITISSPYKFDYKKIERAIIKILEDNNTPFEIKQEKTRFGSSSGRNWNLGIMLNKDNRITIGHKQNQRFRAALHNLMKDYKNGIKWSPEDRQVLGGEIAWYKSVDPEYTQEVIRRYETKFGLSLNVILKESM